MSRFLPLLLSGLLCFSMFSVLHVSAMWAKNPSNPVLDIGVPGSWDDLNVWAPTVLLKDGLYRMWFSGSHNGTYGTRIGLATSSDGLSWTRYGSNPVLNPGPSGWDSSEVQCPSVLFNGSHYCMWYSGTLNIQVGLATSIDGINWTKYAGNPVFTQGHDPSVLFNGSTYEMWYSGNDGTIKYATSPNGISWTQSSSNPVLNHGASGSWDSKYVMNPSVVFNGSTHIMAYAGEKDDLIPRIGLAYSSNGINWTRDSNNPIIDLGPVGSWDAYYVDQPGLLLVGSAVKMWYSGFDGTYHTSGFGYYHRIGLARLEHVVASFTYHPTTPLTNEAITFNGSLSTSDGGAIANYSWNFGDGSPNSTGMITTHNYTENGIYAVRLNVVDDFGQVGFTSQNVTVLNRPPVSSFTESATSVPTGTTIYFNASASYDPDGSIVSYFWNFGDHTNATGINVSHAYAKDGNYTVTLTVTDNDGSTASSSDTKNILNRSPIAIFTESKEEALTGETITFNASASYDPDGTITSYFWNLGDGTNATGISTSHAYSENGTYTVTLTITDNEGATGSTSAAKTILNRSPVAVFTESAETGYTGELFTFNASASHDPDGFIVNYFWNFGDGTNATGVIAEHTYGEDGGYIVTLIVTDNDGSTGTASAAKTVLNRPPVAVFAESAETGYTGELFTFNASTSYDVDGSVVDYFWDFGDGTNATGVVASHAYADNGTYTVTLTVTDDDGSTASASATKNVLNRPPVAVFTESAEQVLTGETITFNASASFDPDGSVTSYFWDFGDGTNTTGVSVGHAYAEDGNYIVTLTVTDNDGSTASTSAVKNVMNRPPVAAFAESAETGYTGELFAFNASASYDIDGSVVDYFWDFGDGTNASGMIVTHAFSDEGTCIVILTVTDDDGFTGTITAAKTVLNRAPVAEFAVSASTVYTGDLIYFNASASNDPDGTIASYFWVFGDGTSGTGMIADHVYLAGGTYTITLTVTDDDGAYASTSTNVTVLTRPGIAVTEVTLSKTIVGQGYRMGINVTAANYGDRTETFNLTVYANTTAITTISVTLHGGESTAIVFKWNTTGFAKGNYNITATAEPLPGETNVQDNTHSGGIVAVAMVGDLNADGKVDERDVYKAAKTFGSYGPGFLYAGSPPSPRWNPVSDINDDNEIDLKDYYIVCRHFGEVDP